MPHDGRMGKRPARIKHFARDILLRLLDEKGLTRSEMADALKIHVKTLNGLLRPTDPRPVSTDVREALRAVFGVDLEGASPPVAGTLEEGPRAAFHARPTMPSDLILATPVTELGLEPGDAIRVEPYTGPVTPGGWFLITYGDDEDVLVQGGTFNGVTVFREADAPRDDVRVFMPDRHRVTYEVTARVHLMRRSD